MADKRRSKRPKTKAPNEQDRVARELPPANPPRPKRPFLIGSSVLLLIWLGFLVWMAIRSV